MNVNISTVTFELVSDEGTRAFVEVDTLGRLVCATDGEGNEVILTSSEVVYLAQRVGYLLAGEIVLENL